MFSGVWKKREKNPREDASWISVISFFFAGKIFRKAFGREFKQEDIYEIIRRFDSSKVGDELEKEWEYEKRYRKGWLLRPMVKMIWKEFLILELSLIVFETPYMFITPILVGKVTSYFTPGQTEVSTHDAYIYTAELVGMLVYYNTFNNVYLLLILEMSLKVRIACSSLLYRKCLKLNDASVNKCADGLLVTLLTKDVTQFETSFDMLLVVINGLLQLFVLTYVTYRELGAATFFGAGFMLLILPIHAYLGYKTSVYRLKTAKRTDQRVKITQEILTAIRIVKMYTWELFFSKSVNKLRRKELFNLRILLYIKALVSSIGELSSKLALYICIISYVALGNHITAEKAFIVTGTFAVLQAVLTENVPSGITKMAEFKASLHRITEFLQLEEVPENQNIGYIGEQQPTIFIENVTIKTSERINILENINFKTKEGLTVLTGPVGAGKSTLLKLILSDMKKLQGIVEIAGKISYASQEPWLFPGTIKQNIIFSERFDEKRYETVIKVCALKKDFEAFPERDRTCLTDKGLNLSRGQKNRINLARAIYKIADIYLLDDCLSAVDTSVGKHIFYECIRGFLNDNICILVAHQGQFLREADSIVVLDKGNIRFQGSYTDLNDGKNTDVMSTLNSFNDTEENYDKIEASEDNSLSVVNFENADESSKLLISENPIKKDIYEENIEEGTVKKDVYFQYFLSGGIILLLLVVVLSLAAHATSSWADYFVSFWVDNERELSGFRYNQTTGSPEYIKLEQSHNSTMRNYSFVIVAAIILTMLKSFAFFNFALAASKKIHGVVLEKIVNASMVFFDMNLSGNILNRFSRDLGILDEQLPYTINSVISTILTLLATLLIISSVNLFFLIPSMVLIIILVVARYLYIPAGRSLRRLEGATRSPVIGHLNATLEGLTTIRANQAQRILKKEFDRHQDLYNSVCHMNMATKRAFAFYLEILGSFYITVVTLTFLFLKTEALAGQVGLAITKAFSLLGLLQIAVKTWTEFENQMTSTERVLEYTKIKHEEKIGDKLNNWPSNGRIVYTDVNLQYHATGETILKDINFEVRPKQKLGIVGRTGAGKSSIISALFRMYEYRGSICIDDVDIKSVGVELLRSKISIIPQDPVLFSGTIRSNLDPNNEYSDEILWEALKEVEMKKLISHLDLKLNDGNSNFSVGQKQLICLARAVIRNNIILILDEATANVDPQTDSLIQRTIKRKFSHCTVITIAHRLHTIMDSDYVLVLNSGNIVEYDHPEVLIEKEGLFYSMVKEAGLL